jgi:hypothetical protein
VFVALPDHGRLRDGTVAFVHARGLVRVLALVSVAIVMVACSGSGPSAASLAREACSVPYDPAETVGQVIDGYAKAQTFSAHAAAKDRRWEQLNSAIGTLISAWGARGAFQGRDATAANIPTSQRYKAEVIDQWGGRVSQAVDTEHSECAVAKAA